MINPVKTYKIAATYRDFETTEHKATSPYEALEQRFPDSDFIKYQHSGRDAFRDRVYAVRDVSDPVDGVITVTVYEQKGEWE